MSTAPSTLAGRYELLHEIGRGGAASVHVARDTHLERQVAVKLLHPELASALGHGRFLREIRIASGLRHPHIVPVLDFGESEGRLWYAMPYLEGGSLRTRLEREGQLRMESTLRWGAEVADALAFAHAQGFVHRDVKPENLLLDGDHALLADFGIARGIDAATRETLTSAGIAVGTPAYMSPEQASGSGEIDGRSDVYSLGCVLYECLAGVPPFTGPTPQSIIAQRFAHAPHPVTSYRDTVSAPVAELIESALRMAPADRPGAAEACSILRGEWTGELRVSARRSGAGAAVPARRTSTRSRVAAVAGVAAIAAVISAMWPSAPALDPGKVVIYPLVNGGSNAAGISSLLGVALDGVPSLRWVEGEPLLPERTGDPAAAHDRQLDAARGAGAGHFIDGSVINMGDSVRVVMRLVDTNGDSVVARAGAAASGGAEAVPALALRVVGLLLPQLLTPGSQWDVRALSERHPAAIAAFLVGEREFRSSRYEEALARYQEALALDSNLAIAALKAARSARSLFREEEARRFVRMALARDSLLPGANLHFARGLASLYQFDADAALTELRAAARLAPRWAEVQASIADVYFYVGADSVGGIDVDSAARAHYALAHAYDSSFTPALYHLTWLDARAGDTAAMRATLDSYLAADGPDTTFVRAASAARHCLTSGSRSVDWGTLTRSNPAALVQLGKQLAGGDDFRCSRAALGAVLFRDVPPDRNLFGSLLVLEAIAVATRDSALLDSLVTNQAARALQVGSLVVLGNVADPTWAPLRRAADVEASAMLRHPEQLNAEQLWMLGAWLASRDRAAELEQVTAAIRARPGQQGVTPSTMLLSIAARRRLLAHDTSGARRDLARPDSSGTLEGMAWKFQRALVADRVLLGQIAMATGDARRALRHAEQAAHPFAVNAIMFRRPILELRAAAAGKLGNAPVVREARRRVARMTVVAK